MVASWADRRALFAEALLRKVMVPWGVECQECGLVLYGEDSRKPCLACNGTDLTPLYAGKREDISEATE